MKVIFGKNLVGKVINLKYEEWIIGIWIFSMYLCMDELDYGWLYMVFLFFFYDGYELDD